MKVLIIGSGNMGKTYARSFLTSSFIEATDLFILDKNRSHAASLAEIPAENIHAVADTFIKQADIIILAVKPQDFPALAKQIDPYIQSEQLVISIMAGIRISTIKQLT